MSVVIYQYGILLISWSIIGNRLFGHNIERLKNFFAGLRCNAILGFNRFPIYHHNKYHALYNDMSIMVFYNVGLTLMFAIYYYSSKVKRRKEITIGTLQKLHDNFKVNIIANMDDIVRFKMFIKIMEKHKHYMAENAMEIDHCKQFFERFEHHSLMRFNHGMQLISCLERIKKYALCAVFLRMKVRNMSLLIRNVQQRYKEQNPHKENKRGYISLLKEKLQLTVEEIDEFKRSAEIAIAGKTVANSVKANNAICGTCRNVNCGGHAEHEDSKSKTYDLLELENFVLHQRGIPRADMLPGPYANSEYTQHDMSPIRLTTPSRIQRLPLDTSSYGKSDEQLENAYSAYRRHECGTAHTSYAAREHLSPTQEPLGTTSATDRAVGFASVPEGISHGSEGNSRLNTRATERVSKQCGVQSHRNGPKSRIAVAKRQNSQNVGVGTKWKKATKLHMPEAVDTTYNQHQGYKDVVSAGGCASKPLDVIAGASESDDKKLPHCDDHIKLKGNVGTNIRDTQVNISSVGKNGAAKMRVSSLRAYPRNPADDAIMGSMPNIANGKQKSITTERATNVIGDYTSTHEVKPKMSLTKRSAHTHKAERTGIFKESIL
ncbi:50S ribosomal protein L9 [Babesia ovata]|uniref:50S ribosomal protein L9 n=1 Tax=Babesia ovata TaxID=189622 RepID=A0A2H6KIA0_9APIC|nr:50S ribosomal protein L9 [Babesia ovata]GBE62713.1 50S ribosomal protein L9 [Babesia ovata]